MTSAKQNAYCCSVLGGLVVSILALMVGVGVGCGDGGPGGNDNESGCPEGHRAEGPACVPIFDDPSACSGPNEMPALGGGCRPVGVFQCAVGFERDGEGGCEPILPDHDCPPGTMDVIGETECRPVGVVQCAVGFVSDGEGGCDAILPTSPGPGLELCSPGTIALLGHPTCQPLGDCGVGPELGGSPWGNIQDDLTTVYVDTAADATGANGTMVAPYLTVGEALVAVQPGGKVAIAAGEYLEVLVIDKPVRLIGRCSELVTLRGRWWVGVPRAALHIAVGGTSSEVRGVTLTGPAQGLEVSGAQQVVVEEVEVRDASDWGVAVQNGAEMTLRRVKVADCTTVGVFMQDSTVRMEQTVVRGTRPQPGTGYWGRGIDADCSLPDACGSLWVEGSLVTGNRQVGILSEGVDTTVLSSVVRDTLSRESDQTGGTGIEAECNPDLEVCGSLWVEGSLVTGNRRFGILSVGVDTTVLSSVVRDTLPQESDQASGGGINAQCDVRAGVCGSLLVERSLVTGNRDMGIFVLGLEATVLSSVVRDTLWRESDEAFGRGIGAQCYADLGVCGSLWVEGSLVTGNREYGIYSAGVDSTVIESGVLGTLPLESDQTVGRGISVHCHPDLEVCGSLWVEGSLVTGNRDVGVYSEGVDTTVLSSVLRGMLPQESDHTGGLGIGARCNPVLVVCGSLWVEGSLVTGNRQIGIYSEGVDSTVLSSVVRDTLPRESDQEAGRGIDAMCNPDLGVCGSLLVEGSLVTGNRELGVFSLGVDSTVLSSVVRDTLPRESDQAFGRGIGAQCDLGFCGSLWVEGSLVSGNRELGIYSTGVDTTVLSSVVRDTLPRESDQAGGRGINAQCNLDSRVCGSLSVQNSLVVRSEDAGISIFGVPAILQGVAVVETATNNAGPWAGEHGQGIWAVCPPLTGECGTLSISSCLVDSSHGAGVALEGVSGFMSGSVVDTVLAQPKGSKYGYGVQIAGLEGEARPTFHVRECLIRDSKLVGVFYFLSEGLLSGSVVSGGEYSVAMNVGSSPTFGDGNDLSGIVENDPAWVSLYPCPAPPPALPSAVLE